MLKDVLLLTVFPGAMAFAASMDLFTFTVPNRIAIALVVGFAMLAPMIGLGWPEIGWHLLAAFGALAWVSRCSLLAGSGEAMPSCLRPRHFGSVRNS